MIKNLMKDLRTYRKDTFITSFFATLTVLLIVIILCSIPSNAQTVSGGSANDNNEYEYDSDDYYGIGYYFKGLDITKTNPTGVLYRDGNPALEQNSYIEGLYAGHYNLSNSYASVESPIPTLNSYLNGQTVFNIPKYLTFQGVNYDLTEYNKFLFTTNGQTLYLSLFKSNVVNITFQSGNLFWIDSDDAIILKYEGSVNNNPVPLLPILRHINGYGVDDDVYLLAGGDTNQLLVYSNCSCMGDEYSYPSEWERETSYFSAEYNYLLGQVGNGGHSGNSSETSDNNLVLDNGKWTFTNKDYYAPYISQNNIKINSASIYPDGNISFSFIPTNYQIQNSQEFNLVFSFYWDYDVDYKNSSGSDSNKPFQKTLLNKKNYKGVYNYYQAIDSPLTYIEVPLSDFIDNGNTYSWTWSEIMDNLYSGDYSFTHTLTRTKTDSEGVDVYSYNVFNIYATAFLDGSNSGKSSGNITEFYNPMNKKQGTSDASGKINKNPYNDTDNDDVSTPGDAPGDAGNNGNGAIAYGSNVQVTNSPTFNNNPTITINNSPSALSSSSSSGGGSGNTIFETVFSALAGSNKVSSESLSQSMGTNGFVNFMKNSFGFVPASVFTALTTFFVTCLGILIVAFILRMVLDIL